MFYTLPMFSVKGRVPGVIAALLQVAAAEVGGAQTPPTAPVPTPTSSDDTGKHA